MFEIAMSSSVLSTVNSIIFLLFGGYLGLTLSLLFYIRKDIEALKKMLREDVSP